MATKLFIGGLAYAVREDQLRELFESVGVVQTLQIIMDKQTGQSKGFAFVEMATDSDTQKAISELDGKELEGRAISVGEARPQEKREPRSYGGGGGGGFRGGNGGGGGGSRRNDRGGDRGGRRY